MAYTFVNPYNGFGEMHNECMDYVVSNYSYSDPIESLASVVLDFFETKTGISESSFTRQSRITDLISSLNYASINADPFYVSNSFTSVIKVGLDKIKTICTSGENITTVITQLHTLASEFEEASTGSNDYQALLGTIAIAQHSASYWEGVVNNVGSTAWDPWLPPYDPDYAVAAPLWAYADAAGWAVGYLRYSENHEGKDFNMDDAMIQAGRTAALFSGAFIAFVIIAILL